MAADSSRKAFLLVVSILLLQCHEARKFNAGGGGGRGNSGARNQPQPAPGGGAGGWGGGAHPQGGGFGGQPHFGGGGGAPNFRPGPMGGGGGFHSGTGMGSASRGSSFKTALAGAALGTVGGLLAFEAGKAIIRSFDQPFHHDNRDYYWGQEYAKRRPDEHMCTYDFDRLIADTTPTTTSTAAAPAEAGATTTTTTTPSPEQALAHATFPNGTRPKQIVWSCKNWEQCCGTDCCPAPQSVSRADGNNGSGGGAISTLSKFLLILTLVGLLLCCCCGLIAYKFCRSAFDSFLPRGNNNNNNTGYDASKYDNVAGGGGQQQQYANQAQSYPMQPYPPPQQQAPAYPPAPQYPSAYPPAPGYYEGQKY